MAIVGSVPELPVPSELPVLDAEEQRVLGSNRDPVLDLDDQAIARVTRAPHAAAVRHRPHAFVAPGYSSLS